MAPRLELLVALAGGGKPFGDLLLALLDSLEQRRPDVLHAEPDEYDHRDRLADESSFSNVFSQSDPLNGRQACEAGF